MDTFIHYGIAAAVQAVQDAGLPVGEALDEEFATRIGCVIGSGIGGLPMIEATHEELTNRGPRRISPFFVPATIINMISGHVSIRFGFKGPNIAIVTACTTGSALHRRSRTHDRVWRRRHHGGRRFRGHGFPVGYWRLCCDAGTIDSKRRSHDRVAAV